MSDNKDDFVPMPPTADGHAATPPPAHNMGAQPGVQKTTSGAAVAGLIFSFFIPLVGLILSIIGLNHTKNDKQGGRGLAIAGLIISILGMLLGLFWLVAFVIAAVNADTNVRSDSSYYDSSLSDLSKDPTINKAKIGEAAKAENLELIVKDVNRAYQPSDDYYTPEEGKRYVAVNVDLKNVGSSSETFSSYDFKMRDSTGLETSEAYVGSYAGRLSSGSLAAGGATTGTVVFEVPTAEQNLTLVFMPSFVGDEVVEVTL